VILLTVALLVRAQTFGNPVLGYDEQFYLLVGERMLHGAVPYVDIFDRKPIGLFLIYAFAQMFGGNGFIAYKLLALGFVVGTALGLFHVARRFAGPFGATAASALFVVWHSFMGGEGGQSPVFYDPFVLLAAALVIRAMDRPETLVKAGGAAMLSMGLAMQIKYCALFEGAYFGCVLLWLGMRQGMSAARLAACGALWIGLALAPTLAVLGAYAAMGHASEFLFANFISVMAQGRNPLAVQLRDLLEIAAILSPLLLLRGVGSLRGAGPAGDAAGLFLRGWFVVSLTALLVYFRFNTPHYAIPLLLPLCIWLAPLLDAPRRRVASVALVGIALVAAQFVLADQQRMRGGAREAALVTAAARPTSDGCIYVYAGYPALYQLTGSCLPSRWAFPGGLNMADEANAKAQGVDPVAEVQRILAQRPPVIVDEFPVSPFGNPATHALVRRAIARDYVLAARVGISRDRAQLVYRLKGR